MKIKTDSEKTEGAPVDMEYGQLMNMGGSSEVIPLPSAYIGGV